MNFEDWFDQIEAFSMRNERFYEDLKQGDPEIMVKWLKAAYETGREHERHRDFDATYPQLREHHD